MFVEWLGAQKEKHAIAATFCLHGKLNRGIALV